MDGNCTEWCGEQKSLRGWHTGAKELFNDIQVSSNFLDGIQVKDLNCSKVPVLYVKKLPGVLLTPPDFKIFALVHTKVVHKYDYINVQPYRLADDYLDYSSLLKKLVESGFHAI
jgi:hypothetical protein